MSNSALFNNLKKTVTLQPQYTNIGFFRKPDPPLPPPPPAPPLLTPDTNYNCIIDLTKILNSTDNNDKKEYYRIINQRQLIPKEVRGKPASLTTQKINTETLTCSTKFIKQPAPICSLPYRFSNEPTARIIKGCNTPCRVLKTG